ncbi:MAG: aminotransferase class V-fold PLP-dependent enzyme [bacterium]|nr:aminotransferase class V-fold PLP-dependent enzyme [bacterium]
MSLNIKQLRNETPGCEHVLHFNNAGAALPPLLVTETIKNHLDLESIIGGYEAADKAADQIAAFYTNAAHLIRCESNEIAFMDSATRAWDMAFYSLKLKKGDKVLTAVCEYASNYLALLHKAKTTGIIIEVVKNDAMGQLDILDLELRIDDSVKLIAITHVPTNGGLINPAQEIGKIANKYNIPYLLDTTQSIGQMPIDVNLIGCDFLCATGRKYLRGPRGTGFLYAHSRIIDQCEPPFVDLHSSKWIENNHYSLHEGAQRFETWEQNIAGKLGLSIAINYLNHLDINLCWQRILHLATCLRTQLETIENVQVHDLGISKCGIVTFTCNNKSSQEVKTYLNNRGVNVSISLLEYARLDMAPRNLTSLIRASVHYYNSEEEVNFFCEHIAAISA